MSPPATHTVTATQAHIATSDKTRSESAGRWQEAEDQEKAADSSRKVSRQQRARETGDDTAAATAAANRTMSASKR